MQIIYTQTGSKGNSTVIQSKSGGLLVIDCGIKYDKVNKEVGYQLHKVEACLITHAHADHTVHMGDFMNAGIITYLLPETRSQVPKYGSKRYCRDVTTGETYSTKSFVFVPVSMVHTNNDGTHCPCVGYLIADRASGEKMLWATDTQYIANRFYALDYYCIEANFIETDNWTESLPYIEKVVEQRRLQSHMSVETAIKFLQAQDLSKCKAVYLLHMSSSLSDKERKEIIKKVKKVVGRNIKVYSCKREG